MQKGEKEVLTDSDALNRAKRLEGLPQIDIVCGEGKIAYVEGFTRRIRPVGERFLRLTRWTVRCEVENGGAVLEDKRLSF